MMSDFMSRVRDLGQLFWRNARQSGEAAAEALEQRAAIQRLAGQIRKLDKERGELVRQIGGKVYALHGQGKVRNQDVLGDCQRIDTIREEIGTLQREIEKIRLANLEKDLDLPDLSDASGLTDEADEAAPLVVEIEDEDEGKESEVATGEVPPADTVATEIATETQPDGADTVSEADDRVAEGAAAAPGAEAAADNEGELAADE
jgi:hypothetical protein